MVWVRILVAAVGVWSVSWGVIAWRRLGGVFTERAGVALRTRQQVVAAVVVSLVLFGVLMLLLAATASRWFGLAAGAVLIARTLVIRGLAFRPSDADAQRRA